MIPYLIENRDSLIIIGVGGGGVPPPIFGLSWCVRTMVGFPTMTNFKVILTRPGASVVFPDGITC